MPEQDARGGELKIKLIPGRYDRPDWQNWIYSSVFSFRRWSEYATIQPYFLGRKQYDDPYNTSASAKVHRYTFAPGLRIYGCGRISTMTSISTSSSAKSASGGRVGTAQSRRAAWRQGNVRWRQVDVRARYKLSQFVNLSASYARFWTGSFTSSFTPPVALQQYFPQSFPGQATTTNGLTAKPTDFFYLEVTANGFGDGNPITKNPATELVNLASPEAQPAPPPSWNDLYVGLNSSGAWSNPLSNVRVAPISTAPPSAPVATASNMLDSNNHLAGFVGGLRLGANWRFAKHIVVVSGEEATADVNSGRPKLQLATLRDLPDLERLEEGLIQRPSSEGDIERGAEGAWIE